MSNEPGAWDIYAEQLFFLKLGLPLWAPEPTRAGEVLVGDVGYIDRGGFYRLFNTVDDKTNALGDDFVPFSSPAILTQSRDAEVNQRELHSKSLTSLEASAGASAQMVASVGGGLHYKSTDERGALLLLKRPGNAKINHADRHIKDYIRLNYSKWCDFARDLGLGKREEDLIFVSGHVKTADWTVAAYTSRTREGELFFTGDFGPSASANASLSISHSVSMSVQYRCGPPNPSTRTLSAIAGASGVDDAACIEEQAYDQCIFLNYYKMKKRAFMLQRVIQAAAGPHNLPEPDDSEPDVDMSAETRSEGDSIEEVPDRGKPYDPVQYLLDYILTNSDAEIAIASDRDFLSLCDVEIPRNIPAMLEHLKPKIDIDEHGVGTISNIFTPSFVPEDYGDADVELYDDFGDGTTDSSTCISTPRSILSDFDVPENLKHRLGAFTLAGTSEDDIMYSEIPEETPVYDERVPEDSENNSKSYSFISLPGNNVKMRPRRRYDEIERLYQCSWPNCTKAYGTLNHLNAHVVMHRHGPKRSPAGFKELRKQWRQTKKEADEAGFAPSLVPSSHDVNGDARLRTTTQNMKAPAATMSLTSPLPPVPLFAPITEQRSADYGAHSIALEREIDRGIDREPEERAIYPY